MNNKKITLPRTGKPMRRKSMDTPGIGASTTWHGATTRRQTVVLAKSAPPSKIMDTIITAQATLATVINSDWQALMANMAPNMARPAWKQWTTYWFVFMGRKI